MMVMEMMPGVMMMKMMRRRRRASRTGENPPCPEPRPGVALARDGQSAQADFVCSLRRIHSLCPDVAELPIPRFMGVSIPDFENPPPVVVPAAEGGR
jgi:hypothetical protein